MVYQKEIINTDDVHALYGEGIYQIKVVLEVGKLYKVTFKTPTTKKDRKNNGRVVEILGFSDSFMGDAIVRYLDNNRIGRLKVNCLLPFAEE